MTNTDNLADSQAIAIIDLGGQTCHLIGRRLRDIGVRTEIFDHDVSLETLSGYSGLILSGGPQSVYDESAPKIDERILQLGKPILGICYGHQLLARLLGSDVQPCNAEFGRTLLQLRKPDSLFRGTPSRQTVWMNHADSVRLLPKGVEALARTKACDIAAFGDMSRKLFGVQFHPEVAHTEFGTEMLRNFTLKICGITRFENVQDRVSRLLTQIRERVKDQSVLFFVSGGVDSTVAFSLCAKALQRDKVLGVYVDTGLMRKNETKELKSLLDLAGLGDRLRIRDESARFLDALKDVVEPEKKRHVIGRLFIDVQAAAMREYGINQESWLLGQGTIYPDTIESGGTAGSAVIKTHHNRCEEVRELIARGRVIEPLTDFYKDEVRQLGAELGLGTRLTDRWPFPGPGLAIRVLCRDGSPEGVKTVDLPSRFGRYQAVHFPINSVGLQGDSRTYRQVVAVRGRLNYNRLSEISTFLCNTGRSFNRVVAHLEGKTTDLAKAHVMPAKLDRQRIALLRDADHIVKMTMEENTITHTVWQFPTILIPVSFGDGQSVVLRPVNSTDGMTATFGRLPIPVLRQMAKRIARLSGVDAVFLDITDKPPATIEWE